MICGYIDRIEEELAVILINDGEYQINFPAALLPEDVGEGMYINMNINEDEEKNKAAMEEAMALLQD